MTVTVRIKITRFMLPVIDFQDSEMVLLSAHPKKTVTVAIKVRKIRDMINIEWNEKFQILQLSLSFRATHLQEQLFRRFGKNTLSGLHAGMGKSIVMPFEYH